MKKYYESKGKLYVTFNFKDPKQFYETLYAMEKMRDDSIQLYGTSREGQMEVVVESTLDIDENTKQISNHAKEEKDETKEEGSSEETK